MSAHSGPTDVAAATTRHSTRNDGSRTSGSNPTGPRTPSASFARLNAVKFTAFISIIMHTGGPNPRYAPDTPSRTNRRPSVATNVARPGTSFTPAWPVCMRLLTTSSGYPSTVPTSPAHAPAAASCDALCADIERASRTSPGKKKRTAPRNVSRPSCPSGSLADSARDDHPTATPSPARRPARLPRARRGVRGGSTARLVLRKREKPRRRLFDFSLVAESWQPQSAWSKSEVRGAETRRDLGALEDCEAFADAHTRAPAPPTSAYGTSSLRSEETAGVRSTRARRSQYANGGCRRRSSWLPRNRRNP